MDSSTVFIDKQIKDFATSIDSVSFVRCFVTFATFITALTFVDYSLLTSQEHSLDN